MPTNDCIKRSDALKAILGVSIYDTIKELDGARTIAENTWADGLYDAYKIIEEEVDAVDVAAVIRCKDCKYKPTAPDGITYGLQVEFPDKWANRCPCLCEDGWYSWVPDDNFFCAYGAKKDAEPPKEEGDAEIH